MKLNGKKALVFFKGNKGDAGAKIVSTEYIGIDKNGGYIYKQTFDDGTTAQFTAPKGDKGEQGLSIYYTPINWVYLSGNPVKNYYIALSMFSGIPNSGDLCVTNDGVLCSVKTVNATVGGGSVAVNYVTTLKGDKGEQGATGAKIVSIEYKGVDEDGGYIYEMAFDNGAIAQFTAPKGATGAKGDTGATGEKGEKGDTGDKGATGAKIISTVLIGQDGSGGNVYEQTFDDGTATRFTAPKGEKGEDGAQGEQGLRGYTGAKILSTEFVEQDENGGNVYKQTFDNGVTAEFTAPKGEKGDKGETGAAGATGAQIVSTEYVGIDSEGGYIYRQTFDNGVTAEFTAPKGGKGDRGEQGEQGATGAQIVSTEFLEYDENGGNVYQQTFDNGVVSQFTAPKGDTGAKILSTVLIGVDDNGGYIYEQTFDNGTTAQFTAPKGDRGYTGARGATGATGAKLSSMVYIGEDELGGYVYEMTFDDGVKAQFTAPRGDNEYLSTLVKDLLDEPTIIDIIVKDGTTVYLDALVGVTSVDWGDGAINNDKSHTYAVISEEDCYRTLKIYGCEEFSNRIQGTMQMGENIRIGNSVKIIRTRAFNWGYDYSYHCKNLTIGKSVTLIEAGAFYLPTVDKITFNATNCADIGGNSPAIISEAASNNGTEITIGKNVERVPANLFDASGASMSEKLETTNIVFEDGSVCESVGAYGLPDADEISGKIYVPRLRFDDFQAMEGLAEYVGLFETTVWRSEVAAAIEERSTALSQQIEESSTALSQQIENSNATIAEKAKVYLHRLRFTSTEQTTVLIQPIYSSNASKIESAAALSATIHGNNILGTTLNNTVVVLEATHNNGSEEYYFKLNGATQTNAVLTDYVFEI